MAERRGFATATCRRKSFDENNARKRNLAKQTHSVSFVVQDEDPDLKSKESHQDQIPHVSCTLLLSSQRSDYRTGRLCWISPISLEIFKSLKNEKDHPAIFVPATNVLK